MLKKIILFLGIGLAGVSYGQMDISFYCDVMTNAYEAENRVVAAQEFETLFTKELQAEGSFSDSFKTLKWVSIKYPQAKDFRIITWPIRGKNNVHSYKGFIQTNEGKLFELNDRSGVMEDFEFEQHSPDNWYGALYYNMIENEIDGDKSYVLFGHNGKDDDVQVKIIEELHFEDGQPVFGREIFRQDEDNPRPELKTRIAIEYSDNANVNCNYDDGMQMIVHDFVTPRFGVSSSGRPVKIPDGTYVGYIWKKDYWKRIDKIAHQISTPESIFYQPKPKEEKRDVIGRPVKKN